MVIREADTLEQRLKPDGDKIRGNNGELTETGIQTTTQTTTKYMLIADTIRQRITNGEYNSFQRLSRGEFAREFKVHIQTITEAFSVLREEGYIIGENNKIYVSNPDSTENPVTQLHQIVAYIIRKRIERGDYRPGERMPTLSYLESDRELGASHVTIVKAINVLKSEGLLVLKEGRGFGGFGIFVSADYGKSTTQYGK